jgi:TP901 family phage tail tape measure protein
LGKVKIIGSEKSKTMSNVGSVEVDILLAIDELRSQVGLINQELGQIKSVSLNVQTKDAMNALGEVAGYAERIFNTAQAFIGGAVNNFVGFSGQINSLGALSGATTEELKALKDETIRLGIVTSKSPQQVAGAAIELTKLGFSAEQVNKELGGLVALAEATGGSMDVAGQIVGATTSIFEASATDIADIVAATANSTAADMNDFLQVISKVGGVARANGQSLEVLATAFGLIRNTGFTAETASTALKNSIIRLAAPTGKAKESIEQLGIQLRDETGNMRSLIDLIPEFRTALENVTPEEKAQLVKAIFGDEAGPAFLGLLSTSQEKIEDVFATISNSAGRPVIHPSNY